MIRVALFVALLLGSIAPVADAPEPFPTRPITIVNPFPSGGLADLTARPVAAAMERILKEPVFVVNKPGAAGAIGAQTVATAKPDGYTIVIQVNAIGTIPEAWFEKDTERSVVAIRRIGKVETK